MANANAVGNSYISGVNALVVALENLRVLNDRISQDATLTSAALAAAVGRTDLAAADYANAQGAVVQLLFSFDSGAPTQKSFLFKVLP